MRTVYIKITVYVSPMTESSNIVVLLYNNGEDN
jgi:hypothetical protein